MAKGLFAGGSRGRLFIGGKPGHSDEESGDTGEEWGFHDWGDEFD
jgi:hypothetical protein